MNVSHINSTHILDFNYNKTKINFVIYLKIKVLPLLHFEIYFNACYKNKIMSK